MHDIQGGPKKVIPLVLILHCTRGITFLAHPVLPGFGWLRGSVVERRSSAVVLSLSCARPVDDG